MGRRRRRRPRKPRPPATLEGARRVAKDRFGISRLHPEQRDAIEALLGGRDALAVLPTGYGKSLIYQTCALVLDRPTIVVSPLIALMRDQEHALRRVGAPVIRLDSTLKVKERREALARLSKGGTLIVLTTPETLESEKVRPHLEDAQPGLLCVDEAHCISEWGHDFRPAYLRLGAIRRELGIPIALGLTATATPRVVEDIAERLALESPTIVRAPPHRKNLVLSVEQTPGNLKFERAARHIRRLNRPGIVYCATIKAVDEVYAALRRARIPVSRYHGKMKAAERNAAQKRFMKPSKRIVMVATSAFGMGIDKPNIRYVLHFQAPGSLEQYVQEAGRAGRDGKRSRCILLFDPDDMSIQEYLQQQGRADGRQLERVGHAIVAYAEESKSATAKELALAARVPTGVARVVCAQLEQVGLVRQTNRRWEAAATTRELNDGIDELAGYFETQRREDARRLRSMPDYARTEKCRSVFIREWFGEEDPPECGKCDRCRASQKLEQRVEKAVRQAKGEKPKKRRRRRRRRRKRGQGRGEHGEPGGGSKRLGSGRAEKRGDAKPAKKKRTAKKKRGAREKNESAKKKSAKKKSAKKKSAKKKSAKKESAEKKSAEKRSAGRSDG